jgi:hypothetical protein
VTETYLVRTEERYGLIVHRERKDGWYLRPWNWSETFGPMATLTLLICMWSEVLDGVANERYASCPREVQAGREDAMIRMHEESTINTHWTSSGALSHSESLPKSASTISNSIVNVPGSSYGPVIQSTRASFPSCRARSSKTILSSWLENSELVLATLTLFDRM